MPRETWKHLALRLLLRLLPMDAVVAAKWGPRAPLLPRTW